MSSKSLFFIAALALVAVTNGQSISTCVSQCVAAAAALNSCSLATDLACACQNSQFQLDARNCFTQQGCSDADKSAALNLQTSQCSTLTVTGPANPTSRTISVASATSTSSASHTTTSAPSGSASKSGTGTSAASNAALTPTASQGSSSGSSGLQVGSGAFFAAVLAGIVAL